MAQKGPIIRSISAGLMFRERQLSNDRGGRVVDLDDSLGTPHSLRESGLGGGGSREEGLAEPERSDTEERDLPTP